MITNADITIYNRYPNRDTKKEEWRPTVIRGIHWYTNQKTTVLVDGLVSADEYKIRIPQGSFKKKYIDPKAYRRLSASEVENYWTIDNEDYFVKGVVEEAISSPTELLKKYPYVGKVVSHSDNRYGTAPHFRIGGES